MVKATPRIYDLETLQAYEQAQDPKAWKILCLDFDGVIHAYTQGWQGATVIPEEPVPGAIQFILSALRDFSVHIYSNRCNLPGGIEAMCEWLVHYIHAEHPFSMTEYDAARIVEQLWFDKLKPPAWLTIDDRAFQFRGCWPDLAYISQFQPWYKPQTWPDYALSELWRALQGMSDLQLQTDAQLAELLTHIWAEYNIASKESWVLSEAINRLLGDSHAAAGT